MVAASHPENRNGLKPVTATSVAWCGRVKDSRRRKWAEDTPKREALLRSGPMFSAHDAVETAVLRAMADLAQKIATVAWLQLRAPFREALLRGETDLWIVMSTTGPVHALITGAEAAASHAATAHEAVFVVRLQEEIEQARARFNEAREAAKGTRASGLGVVEPIRKTAG